jgi:hypothetical protein
MISREPRRNVLARTYWRVGCVVAYLATCPSAEGRKLSGGNLLRCCVQALSPTREQADGETVLRPMCECASAEALEILADGVGRKDRPLSRASFTANSAAEKYRH